MAARSSWKDEGRYDTRPRDVRLREMQDAIRRAETERPEFCPECKCTRVVCHGKTTKGTQRYKCRGCGKTFTSQGVVGGSRMSMERWMQFAECLARRDSMRDAAATCGVSIATAYRMKGRIEDLMEAERAKATSRKPGRVYHGEYSLDRTSGEDDEPWLYASARRVSDSINNQEFLGAPMAEEADVGEIRRKAEAGDPKALLELGLRYLDGDGVEKSAEDAMGCFREAALCGEPVAAFNLGLAAARGDGVEQSWTEAAYWIGISAGRGLAEAQYMFGGMYEGGLGLEESDVEAAKWYAEAGKQGHVKALLCLADMYDEGRGVPRNHEKAEDIRKYLRGDLIQIE